MSRILKTPYSRERVQSDNPEPKTRAIQSEAKFCDINHIVAKAHQTGQLPTLMGRQPLESFPSSATYQDMLNVVVSANQRFERLPAEIRNAFGNKPENMLSAIEMSAKDKNLASQLREIGILSPLEEAPSAPTTLATEPPLSPEGGTDPATK